MVELPPGLVHPRSIAGGHTHRPDPVGKMAIVVDAGPPLRPSVHRVLARISFQAATPQGLADLVCRTHRQIRGPRKSTTAIARIVAESGLVTNTEASPWLICIALRKCVSASGPRIAPTTAGPTGMSNRRIRYPTIPIR